MAGRFTNNLGKFIKRIDDKAQVGMAEALRKGVSEAAALTPITSSTLINSQYSQVAVEDGAVIGRVGYTADYALPVHDPSNPQTFRRASAEKEFLKKGFERAEPEIRAILIAALKA